MPDCSKDKNGPGSYRRMCQYFDVKKVMRLRSKIPFVLLLLFLNSCSDGNRRHHTNIYIPEGYVGWIRVEYGVEGAEPLPVEWRLPPPMLWNREIIPDSGLLKTSTRLLHTVGGKFYFYDGDIVRRAPAAIELCHMTSLYNFEFTDPNEKREFITYFIGPESEEYRCDEMERFKTGKRFPVYAAHNFAELPVVGNLRAQVSP